MLTRIGIHRNCGFVFVDVKQSWPTKRTAPLGLRDQGTGNRIVIERLQSHYDSKQVSLTCINARGQSSSPGSRLAVTGVLNPARFISHVPTATSSASVSASVSTRQIVVFDGGGAGAAPPGSRRG